MPPRFSELTVDASAFEQFGQFACALGVLEGIIAAHVHAPDENAWHRPLSRHFCQLVLNCGSIRHLVELIGVILDLEIIENRLGVLAERAVALRDWGVFACIAGVRAVGQIAARITTVPDASQGRTHSHIWTL